MKRKSIFVIVMLVVCIAVVGTAAAQSNGPSAPEAAVTTKFNFQGQIERSGTLFTGTCAMQFKLWDAGTAGTQQGSTLNVNTVPVNNGVFVVELDFGNQFNGEARWLETAAKCADDASFTTLPRVALNPTPYAIGLMPGAVSTGDVPFASGNAIFKASNASASDGTALSGQATASSGNTAGVFGLANSPTGAGIWGRNNIGMGVFGESQQGEGVRGTAHNPNHAGVVGVNDGGSFGVYGLSTTQSGVVGESTSGDGVFGGSQQGEGVRGVSHNANHGGVVGVNDASGTGIYGTTNAANTHSQGAVVGQSTGDGGIGVIGRADVGGGAYGVYGVSAAGYGVVGQSTTGYAGYFIGKVGITGADLAERFAATDDRPIEPGTVVVVDEKQPGKIRISDHAYDGKVIGIISGAGGIHTALMLQQDDVLQGDHVVAIAGRVYCRAEAHSAPIKPGDMLTTSSVRGHCMKAADRDQAYGAVIGKALTGLDQGEGLVLVLVNLQ